MSSIKTTRLADLVGKILGAFVAAVFGIIFLVLGVAAVIKVVQFAVWWVS